jgi:hypothetical protein
MEGRYPLRCLSESGLSSKPIAELSDCLSIHGFFSKITAAAKAKSHIGKVLGKTTMYGLLTAVWEVLNFLTFHNYRMAFFCR